MYKFSTAIRSSRNDRMPDKLVQADEKYADSTHELLGDPECREPAASDHNKDDNYRDEQMSPEQKEKTSPP